MNTIAKKDYDSKFSQKTVFGTDVTASPEAPLLISTLMMIIVRDTIMTLGHIVYV